MNPSPKPVYVISEADAERIAQHMADKLIVRLTDQAVVERIAAAWSSELDRHIGRTLRRAVWLVLIGLAGFVAMRSDAILMWLRSRF